MPTDLDHLDRLYAEFRALPRRQAEWVAAVSAAWPDASREMRALRALRDEARFVVKGYQLDEEDTDIAEDFCKALRAAEEASNG